MEKFIPIIIDAIVIIYIIYTGFRGYQKGLLKTAIDILAILIILPLSIFISIPLTNVVYENFETPKEIERSISEKIYNEEQDDEEDVIFGAMIKKAKENTNNTVAKTITLMACRVVLILVFFVFFKLILLIIEKTVGGILDTIPIIDNLNGLGGTALAIVKSFLMIFIILFLLSVLAPVIPDNYIEDHIQKTVVTSELYEHNIITWLIGSVTDK